MSNNFPLVLDKIEQGIWSYDLQKNEFRVLNQSMLHMLALKREVINSPDSWLQFVHPDDQNFVKKSLTALSKKHEMHCTYRYQPLRSEKVRWISEYRMMIFDAQGKALQTEGILTDITEQKANEEAYASELHQKNQDMEAANEELTALNEELQATNEELQVAIEELQAANQQLITANEKIKKQTDIIARQSEEKLNRILHSLNDLVWSVELPSNELVYVSPAVEKIYGISEEEAFKEPFFWENAIHPEDEWFKESKLSEALKNGYAEYTYRIICPNDSICWLYDRVTVVHDEHHHPIRIDGISTDVTELIETQKALEQRELQLKNAQRIAKIGDWEADLINDKLHWSDEIYRIIKTSREEFEPNIKDFISYIHPEDRDMVAKAQEDAKANIHPYDVEYRIMGFDKKMIYLRDIAEVTFDESGKPIKATGVVKDITDEKLTEIQLRKTTERFTLATQSAEIGIWEWNIQKNFLIWDEITCSIYGIQKEEFSGKLDFWLNSLHPDSVDYVQQKLENALQNTENYHVEYKIITANNTIKYVKTHGKVVFDSNHQPKRMIGAMWDITFQKQAEEEKMRYSIRLDTVIESITDAFFIVDRDWKFIRANHTFVRLNNTSEDKIIGHNMWEAFPKLQGSPLQKAYQKAMEMNMTQSFEIFHPEYQLWYAISAYPSKEGLAVYSRDITQEKKAQQQIAFSQKNLDTLINNTTDTIWSIDKNLRFVSANDAYKAATAMLGGRAHIKTGDPAIWENFAGKIASRFKAYYHRALAGERFSVEEYVTVPERENTFIEVSFNPMYDETGDVIGVGCFGRDITERKKAEEEKSHLIQRLIDQNRYLEEFAFITSHNLRAPVARILGLINIFDRKRITDSFNQDVVNNLEKSAGLLDEVIKDIARVLDIRKQENEIREKVYFDNVMLEVKELLAQEIEKTEAEIQIEFSKKLYLYTIKSYVRNIMLNLVSNAIKYKKLNQSPKILIKSYEKSGYLCIAIQDNGLGVDLEKYGKQIFTLYKRFHSHTEGKGMGMYLIKSQVDALGGSIQIQSKVNKGTTVEVCFQRTNSDN